MKYALKSIKICKNMQEKEKLPISVFIFIKKKIIVFSTVLCRYTGVTFLLKTDTAKDQMKIQTLSFMCEIFLRKRQYREEFKKSCIYMSPDPLNMQKYAKLLGFATQNEC